MGWSSSRALSALSVAVASSRCPAGVKGARQVVVGLRPRFDEAQLFGRAATVAISWTSDSDGRYVMFTTK